MLCVILCYIVLLYWDLMDFDEDILKVKRHNFYDVCKYLRTLWPKGSIYCLIIIIMQTHVKALQI